MTSNGLTCKDFVELVTDYLEGALPPQDSARFEAHLAVCPDCNIYLEQIVQTIRWTGTLTEEQISKEAEEKLLTAFREWKNPQSTRDFIGK